MRKTKPSNLTREEILAGIGYEPLVYPEDVPEEVRAADEREMQDYLVSFVQGMAAHLDKIEGTGRARKGAKRLPARPGRKKRPR